jgi:hypothetical protein
MDQFIGFRDLTECLLMYVLVLSCMNHTLSYIDIRHEIQGCRNSIINKRSDNGMWFSMSCLVIRP